LLFISFASCDDGLPPDPFASQRDILVVDESSGLTSINTSIARTNFFSFPYADLSDLEIDGIRFIREEEKASKDYVLSMDILFDENLLDQLYEVERTHYQAGLFAIEKYGLADPTSGKARGNFTSPNIQAFYDTAISDGQGGTSDAIHAAARLQEASYVTITNQLNRVANNRDLRMVYHALATATRNHIRLTISRLDELGLTYEPRFLSVSDFQDIIRGGIEERSSAD